MGTGTVERFNTPFLKLRSQCLDSSILGAAKSHLQPPSLLQGGGEDGQGTADPHKALKTAGTKTAEVPSPVAPGSQQQLRHFAVQQVCPVFTGFLEAIT